MPLYDFHCSTCNSTVERFLVASKLTDSLICASCGGTSIYTPSFWYSSAVPAQRFRPVVIHRDSQGNIRHPAHENAPVPEGFERVELRNIHEVRKFENEVNLREAVSAQEQRHIRSQAVDAQVKLNREVLAKAIGNMSARGKRFYDAMKQVGELKREQLRSQAPIDPGFHLEAFSQDSSNREAYRDKRNDWGRSGQRK